MNELIPTSHRAMPTSTGRAVPDMTLAKALGYERPTNFRNLIKRNLQVLEALGPLLRVEAMVEIGSGARREVTEYHLSRAQAYFLVNKAGTKLADSLAIRLAEVAALYDAGGLVAADASAQAELDAIETRSAERWRLLQEEREARDLGFRALHAGGRTAKRISDKAKRIAAAKRWQRKYGGE